MTKPVLTPYEELRANKFWSKINVTNSIEDCWEHRQQNVVEYGLGTWNGRVKSLHHIAYFLTVGSWPCHKAGEMVRHLCDNKRCCNPYHLRIGTAADNGRDRTRDYSERLKDNTLR